MNIRDFSHNLQKLYEDMSAAFDGHQSSVCRMFGVAGYLNKHREVTLSICKTLKENYPRLPAPSEDTPLMAHWSARLAALDPGLIQERMMINRALKIALEKVALYAQYGTA